MMYGTPPNPPAFVYILPLTATVTAAATATSDGAYYGRGGREAFYVPYSAPPRDEIAELLASVRRRGFDPEHYVQSWFVCQPARACHRRAPRLPVLAFRDPLRTHRSRAFRRSPRRSYLRSGRE